MANVSASKIVLSFASLYCRWNTIPLLFAKDTLLPIFEPSVYMYQWSGEVGKSGGEFLAERSTFKSKTKEEQGEGSMVLEYRVDLA